MAQKNNLTIQVVSIIGGILTAIFFLGFLVVASIIRTETSSLIIGCLFIITTLTISRRLTVPFLDAMNITLYIAGCVLIAYGLNKSTNALFIALAITGIFTFFLSKGFILPFLSVILFIISFLGELAYLSSSIQLLQIAVVPVLAVFLFTNLYERDILTGLKENLVSKYTPFHSGLFVSCICLLAGLSVNYGIPAPYWLLSIFIWIGILLIIQRIMPVMEVTNPVSQIGICILCILICLPTMFAPYLSGSLLLILICFHYGYKAECAAALLLFIYAVSKYYYDLNLKKERNMKKQSRILIITNLLLLLGYLNWSIYQKEQTLRDGQLVLFELAPVDPRSLMQGDYMSLRYREATSDLLGDTQVATHGYAVLNIDSNRVARIVRLKDALEPLNDNELIINYKIVNDRLFLGAESFFFEEGQDTLYQKATYGGLKVNAKGESLLVGLYDKDFLLIKPDR